MAQRRMFTQKITEADNFTTLPPTTQCLYFHLCMNADDDGFSNKIRQAMFNAHADQNDFEILVQKRFIIPFDCGVIVIKHWRMHNLIRADRYHETDYLEEKATLILKDNGVYTDKTNVGIPVGNQMTTSGIPDGNQMATTGIPCGNQMEPEVRLGKDSIGKVINTPLPPTGETPPEHDFSKHSNVENVRYLLTNKLFKDWEYISDNKELWKVIKEWLDYKDEQKPKHQHHYNTKQGLCKLLSQFVNCHKEYGTEAVRKVVNNSIAQEYVGIIWDKISRKKPLERYASAEDIQV